MTLATEVTKKRLDEIDGAARDGTFVRGLYIEGARWDLQAGVLEESKLKELCPEMPIMLIKAIPLEKADFRDFYACPVYKVAERGPTYVATFNLKTKVSALTWVLRGVALLLDVVQ
jgi:dynein heavy chain